MRVHKVKFISNATSQSLASVRNLGGGPSFHSIAVMSSPTITHLGSPETPTPTPTPSHAMLGWLAPILLPLMALTILFLVGIPKYVLSFAKSYETNDCEEFIDGRGRELLCPRRKHHRLLGRQVLLDIETCRTSMPLLLLERAKI